MMQFIARYVTRTERDDSGISPSSILEVDSAGAILKDSQRLHASPRSRFRLSSRVRTILKNVTSPHLQFLKLNQFLYHSNLLTSDPWPLIHPPQPLPRL